MGCVSASHGHHKDSELVHGKESQSLYTVTASAINTFSA